MPGWAPGVYRPATADPSAVKSAFLFDKRLRCDPISVLQMSRFPVMLFPLCFFPASSLSLSLSLHACFLFILSFSSFIPLFLSLLRRLHAVLHSALFLSIIHHWGLASTGSQNHISSYDTADTARPASASAPIFAASRDQRPSPLPYLSLSHPSIRLYRNAPWTPAKQLYICPSAASLQFNAKSWI